MRSALWYVFFIYNFIKSLPSLHRAKRIGIREGETAMRAFCHGIGKKYVSSLIRATGSKIHISGIENIPDDEAVVFISNHQSYFDLGVFIGFIDKVKGYIAKDSLTKAPVLRTWMSRMGCVFINRSDIKQSAKAIQEGIRRIGEGHSMVVFPEGTRSKSSVIGAFKGGAFKLATKTKAPIIPVSLNGSYKIMEANGGKIKPADVFVIIHPPVYTSELTREEVHALPETVREIIINGLNELLDAGR